MAVETRSAPAVKKVGKKKAPAAGSANPSQQSLKGLGTVMVRNEFYRDGYRVMRMVALAQAVAIIVLIVAVVNFVEVRKEYKYFATTEDGRLVPMIPLNQPNLSTPALLSWVAQASAEVMTFGHHDYKRRLQEASRSFTRSGWEGFTTALERSGVMDMVEKNRQVVTAAPAGAPIITSEGMYGDRYQWVVQMPIQVTYQSGAKKSSKFKQLTLVVVRVEQLDSPHGVGINQWIEN